MVRCGCDVVRILLAVVVIGNYGSVSLWWCWWLVMLEMKVVLVTGKSLVVVLVVVVQMS